MTSSETDKSDRSARHRRGPAVRQAILGAAVGLLADSGLTNFNIPEVARRAGVHETSVYRKWRRAEDLALESLLAHLTVELPVPDTGSLRSDLTIFLSTMAAYLQTPLGHAFLSMSLTPIDDETLMQAREQFWRVRQDNAATMVAKAQERGEARTDVDPLIGVEAVLGPVHARVMLTRRTVDTEFINNLIDTVLTGLAIGKTGAAQDK